MNYPALFSPLQIGPYRLAHRVVMAPLTRLRAERPSLAPRPLNVLMGAPGLSVAQLADLGVRRISVGGALARSAWAGFLKAAREIAEVGQFTAFGQAATGAELKALLQR